MRPTTFPFDLHHLALAVRGVLRRQAIRLAHVDDVIQTVFRPRPELEAAWHALFDDALATARPLPFLYHSPLNARAMHGFLGRLGVNFRNVLHLRTTLAFDEAYLAAPLGQPLMTHRVAIEDIVLLRADRAAVSFRATLHDLAGRLLLEQQETFMIAGISPADAARLAADPRLGRMPTAELKGLSRQVARLDAGRAACIPIEIPPDMGVQYGRLSGDVNVVHTSDRLCRLFGHPRPFMQGLFTAQALLACMAEHGDDPLTRLMVTYCRPVYVGQRVTAVLQGDAAELRDAEGRLLARATCERARMRVVAA